MEYTPRELYYYILARMYEQDRQMQLLAWQTSLIVSYAGKLRKPVKPDSIYLSPLKRKKYKNISPEKLKEEFFNIIKQHKKKVK